MTNNSVQIPPTPITPITWKTRLILLRQKLSTVIASVSARRPILSSLRASAWQSILNIKSQISNLKYPRLSPLSLIIGILSLIIAIQIIFGFNYLNRRFGFFRTPTWLTNLLAPKIEYTFNNASRDTGYTIINQNRANGFAMLLSKANQPNVPSGQFTVEDSNISFSLKNTINFSSFVRTTENGRDLVTWQNTLPDTDVVYSVVSDGLKEDIILKSPSVAKTALREKVRYQIVYDLTTTNVKPRPGLDGQITPAFYDIRTNEYRFHIAPLTMVDASGARYDALKYTLKPITGIASERGGFIKTAAKALLLPAYAQNASPITTNYQLIIDLPRDWLADPTRSYPVIIDPTIAHNTQSVFATGYLDRVADEGATSADHPVAAALDANTIALWNLDETSGNVLDQSDSGNTGTPTGTTVVAGRIVNARGFDGSSYINVQDSSFLDITGDFTISAWVKRTGGGGAYVVSKTNDGTSGGYALLFGNAGEVLCRTNNGTASVNSYTDYTAAGSAITADNVWHHLAAVRSGTSCRVYIDGIDRTSVDGTHTTLIANNLPLKIGARSDATAEFLTGQIDDVKIKNVALTAGQVLALLNPGLTENNPLLANKYHELPADANTVGLWHINENAANTCTGGVNDVCDKSGNGNDGAFNGNAAHTTTAKLGASATTYDGTGDYVNIADSDSLDIRKEITIEAWVNSSANSTNYNSVILKGIGGAASQSSYGITRSNSGNAFYIGYSDGVNAYVSGTSQNLPLNEWHHIAGRKTLNKLEIYIDGVLSKSADISANIVVSTHPLRFGTLPGYSDFAGKIDEVRISNIARTPEEIKADAQRYPYATYTSPVLDLTRALSWTNLTWTAKGIRPVALGDGETPTSTTGLIAQWNFNETSGTTAVSGGSCGTTCNGALTTFASTGSQDAAPLSGWTANNRRWGAGAIMFDNSDDYVITTYNAAQNPTGSAITVETWVNSRGFAALDRIVGTANANTGYRLRISSASADDLDFYIGNGTAYRSCIKPHFMIPGSWYHLAATYDGATFNLYVNGRNIGSCADVFTPNWGTTAIAVGGAPEYWNGTIDSTRIYSRALSAGEILANYSAGQIEFQTRTGTDSTPNDGGWEAWKPTTNETQITALDALGLTSFANSLLTRDLTAHPEGDILKFTSTNSTEADSSSYYKIVSGAGTALATNDTIQYDVYLTNNLTGIGNIDAVFTDGTRLKTSVSCHNTDLSGNAYLKWYHRSCTIPSGANGKIIDWMDLVNENNTNAATIAYYDNLVVKNSSGTIKATLYASGDPLYNQLDTESNAANTQSIAIVKNFSTSLAVDTTAKTEGTGSNRLSLTAASPNQLETFNYSGGNTQGWIETDPNNSIDFLNRKLTLNSVSAAWNKSIISHQSWSRVVDRYFYGKVTTGAATNNKMALGWFANAVTGDDTDLVHGLKFDEGVLSVTENGAYYHTGAPVALTAEASTIGLWHFDETFSTKYTGTNTGSSVVAGKFGNGRSFNGTSNYVTMGDNLDFERTSPFTIEAWIKLPADITTTTFIVAKQDNANVGEGYFLLVDANDHLTFALNNNQSTNGISVTGSVDVATNAWVHVAVTYDGSSNANGVKFYVGGTLDSSPTINLNNLSATTITAEEFRIGCREGCSFGWFNGTIDELRVSNIARSAGQIATDAGNNPLTADANTIGLWHMDEASGNLLDATSNAVDSSTNANDGIATGTTIVAGQLSNARSFTGADDVSLGNKSIVDGLANFTIEAWIYPTAQTAATHYRVFSENAVLYVGQYGNQVSFLMGNGTAWTAPQDVTGGTLPLNRWSHVAWVKSGTSYFIYINGALSKTAGGAPATTGTSANVNYISTYDGTGQPWNGRIDELRISNVALTQAQIQANLGSSLYAANTSYETKITLKSTGADYAIKGGAYSNWTTIYNGTGAGLTTTPMRIAVAHNNFLGSIDELAVQNDASTQLFRETFAGRQPWLEITDNGSINFWDDKLVLTSVTAAWDKALISKNAFDRVATKYLYGKYTTLASVAAPNHVMIGWFANADTGTYTSLTHGIYFNAGVLSARENGTNYVANGPASTYVANTTYEFRIKLKSTGADYEIKGGAYSDWTVIYNGTGANLTTTPMRIAITDYNGTGYISELSVYDDAGNLELQDTFNGKQAFVEIDTNNSIDLLDSTLKLNTVSAAWSYGLISKNSYSRVNGRYLYAKYTTGASVTPALNAMVGWAANTDAVASYTNLNHGFYFNSGALSVYENSGSYAANGPATTYTTNTTYEVRITLKPIGAVYEIKGGAYTDWTVVYDGPGGGLSNEPMRVQIAQAATSGTFTELSVYDPLPTISTFSQAISSTNLSAKSKLAISTASDRAGTFLSALFGESASTNYESDANTLGLWHLEERDGPDAFIIDSSGNAKNLVPTGSSFTTAKIGYGRYFNGTSAYLCSDSNNNSVCDDDLDNLTTKITVGAWVNFGSATGARPIIDKMDTANGYFLGLNLTTNGCTTGNLCFSINDGASRATNYAFVPTLNTWYHIVGVYDGTASTISLYVNGQLVSSAATSTNAIGNSTQAFCIGALSSATTCATSFFSGSVDEVFVSSAALTPTNIRQIHEYGKRHHQITFDFVTTPQAAYSSGTSVTINNPSGTTNLTDTLSIGDTIIFKETVGGVETIGQATVTAITNTSAVYGTVTLAAAPTFPAGGYTTAAKVFKWQKEYVDVTGTTLTTDRDAVSNLTYRIYNNTADTNIWLDDLRNSSNYLAINTPTSFDTVTGLGTYALGGGSITSALNRYFQYRAIFSTTDTPVSPQLNSVFLNYVHNNLPVAPVISTPSNGATDIQFRPAFTVSTTDADSDYLQYKFELATDANFASIVMTANQNTSQTGWSGQNAASNTAYNSGSTATFTMQSDLTAGTTYYLRATALDPAIDTVFSNPSATISFTVINLTVPVANPATEVHQTTFTANWSAVASATSYRLDVSTVADFSSYLTGYENRTVNTNSEVLTNIPLATGQTYYYRVRAKSALDTSANSNTVTVRLGLCSAPITGSFSITSSCRFSANVDGVESGSMTITAGNSLTINNGQTIAWNSGRQIIIETGAHIAIAEGGQLKQTNLWMQDVDSDQYASSLTQTAANNAPNANYKRRGTMKTYLFVDQDDTLPEGYHSRPILDPADGSTSWTSTDATASALDVDTTDKLKGPGSLYTGMNAIEGGTSADGALSVTSGTTTINTVATGSLAGTAAANTATVASTTGFAAGNEVFLVQVTGTGAGNQEFRKIASVNSGTQITFTLPLVKTYTNDGSSKAQMVKVPQYSTVDISAGATLTAAAWNGTTGGVLAFRATGTVTNAGTIDMNGKGFSGGTAGTRGAVGAGDNASTDGNSVLTINNAGSFSSAGAAGTAGQGTGAGGGGGAAGLTTGGQANCGIGGSGAGGAGGGAYGAASTAGAASTEGAHGCNNGLAYSTAAAGGSAGAAYGVNTLTTIFLGSGGGGGGGSRGGSGGNIYIANSPNLWAAGGAGGNGGLSGAGGAGGGVIFIATPTLTNTGTIRADGAAGGNATVGTKGVDGGAPGVCGVAGGGGGGGGGGAGGGGGSGGSIRLEASSVTVGTITASGGAAGTSATFGALGVSTNPCDAVANGFAGTAGGASRAGSVGRIRCDNAGGNCSGTTPAPYTVSLPNPTNAFIRRTLASPIDLSLFGHISIWVKSSITGVNILQFGIGEAAATEQTFNISISAANTWEEKVFDISAISATSKDAIRYLHLKYLGGNNTGTFLFNVFTYYE